MTPTNPFDLTGKVVIVTGGNSGIGLGIARRLAAAGATVCVWGRSAERNEAAVAALEAEGAKAASRQVDVTEEEAVIAAMASVREDFGRLDACFANAATLGANSPSFIASTLGEWRSTLSQVVDSVYLTMREAARVLVDQGEGGSLVATSSIAANYGSIRGNHAYASGKAAVATLMRGLAVELARQQIRVNTIVPGWIDGPFMAAIHDNPKLSERVSRRIPMQGWGQPDDIGTLAVYLVSDGARWHTGDEFIVDGGYHIF